MDKRGNVRHSRSLQISMSAHRARHHGAPTFEDMHSKDFVQHDCTFAGHSLGEYSALTSIADVLLISSLVHVVYHCGITMHHAVEHDSQNGRNYAICTVNPSHILKMFNAAMPHEIVDPIVHRNDCLLEIINFNVEKVSYQLDYVGLVQHVFHINPDKGAEFVSQLANDKPGLLIDIQRVVDIFMSQNMIQSAMSFLLDALKDNKPEQGHLQTCLLEMNLIHAPQVTDAILGNEMFSHYDRPQIANLCEKAGYYEDLADIKCAVTHTNVLWLVNYFSHLTTKQSMTRMQEMLHVNMRQNLQVVVQVATKYSDILGAVNLIDMFESFKNFEGLYYYLGSVVNLSEDPEVHFKYIQATTRTGQIHEVEHICHESNFYNPEKVKNFLKEAKLADQLPLIIVCDCFDFIHDLVLYLYQNGLTKFIEVYVQRVNSVQMPQVIGGLLDVDCDETTIKGLLASVTGNFPIDELVHEVEQRNRLKLILPWLEARVQAGSQDPAVYNAMAKIFINSNSNPEQFLKENNLYEPLVVGKFCEARDPYLAYIAYAKGFCDDELIAITNDNSMFKQQARYLVKHRQPDLWSQVLVPDNVHRWQLIDQIVSTAILESTDLDDVSVTVKVFLSTDLPIELIELLEKIIIEPSPFSNNKNLQNLLLLTAIRADKGKVVGYIMKLQNYNVTEITKIATDHGLYEEPLTIYKKHKQHTNAINVLLEYIVSIDCGLDYVNKVNRPEVWSRHVNTQLDGLRVKDSINSYIKAADPSNFAEVMEIADHSFSIGIGNTIVDKKTMTYITQHIAKRKANVQQIIDDATHNCLKAAPGMTI
ncbi:hypothetical protein EWM64_g3637 [Hericium alpestre]|uniref:Uncharacterized protein n=1 Tax=Hericium alpestre TaxID=135208 RepID=A0A4Y9ZZT0_9AGAM|nr:hypothetical protein EWM64_g3637 [Hericium alpestre]